MDSELTETSSFEKMHNKYYQFASKFKFTDLMRNYIQNEEWSDKSQESIWSIISKISDDIGSVLTDDIVNYTRNVVDINTCKVTQLIENAKMLSYGLDNIKNSYQFFPSKIQCLIDLFSVNQEYLIGNGQNHILSDDVIREILTYIKNNSKTEMGLEQIDDLIDNPHKLIDKNEYQKFIVELFFQTIVSALSSKYSEEDGLPIVFNLLYDEIDNAKSILPNIRKYRSWVDKFIGNEIEHPLNRMDDEMSELANQVSKGQLMDYVLPNAIGKKVQTLKNLKKISPKFNPFVIADEIYFNGLNPQNQLSNEELDLVEMVLNYHAKSRYDYSKKMFISDCQDGTPSGSTQYAYYKELEYCKWLKMVMFLQNNMTSFTGNVLSYDVITNKFIQSIDNVDCLKVLQIFHDGDKLVKDSFGNVVLDYELILKISKFLCEYVFYIQGIRENVKTIAHKHAMRGTGALLVHVINDYLIKELPKVRDRILEGQSDDFKFGWEIDDQFNNYGNVKVIEYDDDNEYFNIDPYDDVRFTERTNARYWEELQNLTNDSDSLGVLSKGSIRDFYRNMLGVGVLQPTKPKEYDDIMDFLSDLFRIGANPIKFDIENYELKNPIDEVISNSEIEYGYTKEERLQVQENTQLRRNQEDQFFEYCGNPRLIENGLYDYSTNGVFYWKNLDYSSHVLHPFMYNLKLWNKLNNIIVNGYKDYVNSDLISLMSSKFKFDQLFGDFGEGKNFWKYNILDFTGYSTRYESAIKDEHIDDLNGSISPVTGYDGLFYPDAIDEFVECYRENVLDQDGINEINEIKEQTSIPSHFFDTSDAIGKDYLRGHKFIDLVHGIYWQRSDSNFYVKWYSHLNYSAKDYQKIAIQLWYWRKRIVDVALNEYPISKYCIDIQGNSLTLVSPFSKDDESSNPFLIDLMSAQHKVESGYDGISQEIWLNRVNRNKHVGFCSNDLVKPSELWIRWKSNPIAIPAFDAKYDSYSGDFEFDKNYRSNGENVEFGQLTHTNSSTNDDFKWILKDWKSEYGESSFNDKNWFPVFFDMEQSANILALSSWKLTSFDVDIQDQTSNDIVVSCAKNPHHVISIERPDASPCQYSLEKCDVGHQLNSPDMKVNWKFDAYHYCSVTGSLLIPFYAFDCEDQGRQLFLTKMFLINAQNLKDDNYSAKQLISRIGASEGLTLDLNSTIDFSSSSKKYLFDRMVNVCRNTNVVFSPYDFNGQTKVKCAFLGCFPEIDLGSYKVGSCDAMTRYDVDSKDNSKLSMLKNKNFKMMQSRDNNSMKYVDSGVLENGFNSYDSLDKYVLMIDFNDTIDISSNFNCGQLSNVNASMYNILGDSGYIPHFAYQSLVRYSDKHGGISDVWKNQYLSIKNHLQFELLGLDDKNIPSEFETMETMVVHDNSDDCDTLLNPTKLMSDIYRVWCRVKGEKSRQNPNGLDEYFADEYKDYVNDFDLKFNNGVAIWDVCTGWDEENANDDIQPFHLAQNARLDNYYIAILRVEDGQIQNERKYILPQTNLEEIMLIGQNDNGYVKCNLSRWQSSQVNGEHFLPSQTIFVGTQNPFDYDNEGNVHYSKPQELQYGNGICGVKELHVKVDVVHDENGDSYLKPIVKLVKVDSESNDLESRIQGRQTSVPKGQILVMLSYKNLDDIAKYHMLNRKTSLYMDGSLVKNFENEFKYSDFKFKKTVKLIQIGEPTQLICEPKTLNGSEEIICEGEDVICENRGTGLHWESEDGELYFTIDDVMSDNLGLPPYYVQIGEDRWYLEQSSLFPDENKVNAIQNTNKVISIKKVPSMGNFTYAHLLKSVPEKYLDYLYVNNRGLAFKVNEESQTFADALTTVPGFYIDQKLKNKLQDLNDVQVMQEYSTFIHQSENPDDLRKCYTFNPLKVNAILNYGLEQSEGNSNVVQSEDGKTIILSNSSEKTPLKLELEDNEVEDILKIYTNYVRVDDGNGDFHYDLYFNVQNLFHSPFEYISSITNKPNVLILKDSYLYLSGDKFSQDENGNNVIDKDKILKIKEGGELSIYGQVKTYSNDVLSDVKTIRLYGYRVYNISDDKPKFMIVKTYDITNTKLNDVVDNDVSIRFSDVLYTVKESSLTPGEDIICEREQSSDQIVCGQEDSPLVCQPDSMNFMENKFRILMEDIEIIQPLHIRYDWDYTDDSKINRISFDITNDIIDFQATPELLGWSRHATTLKNGNAVDSLDEYGKKITRPLPYYDHWSDNYVKIEKNQYGGYRLTLDYLDSGFNFETIYLRWRLPTGFRMMDTMDRLGGYVFSSSASNVKIECNDSMASTNVNITPGYVVTRVKEIGTMYLGLEHTTTKRMNGYVITGLMDAITNVLSSAIREQDIIDEAQNNNEL